MQRESDAGHRHVQELGKGHRATDGQRLRRGGGSVASAAPMHRIRVSWCPVILLAMEGVHLDNRYSREVAVYYELP